MIYEIIIGTILGVLLGKICQVFAIVSAREQQIEYHMKNDRSWKAKPPISLKEAWAEPLEITIALKKFIKIIKNDNTHLHATSLSTVMVCRGGQQLA